MGQRVRADMPRALVTGALPRALLAQRPALGLIGHAARGGRYAPNARKALRGGARTQRPPRRRGECCDNAQAESRRSRLKTELLERRDWPAFADLADAQASGADYFDSHSHDRRGSSSGY